MTRHETHKSAVSIALGSLLLTSVVVRPAAAQSASEVVAAETLFDEARALMAKNELGEACPKLEASLRLDTGTGTMLWLAECYQRQGRIASAWAQFRQAAATAQKQNDPRAATARQKASALEARLPKLTIVVRSEQRVAGLEIVRDGEPVTEALYGVEIPVDPGPHTIVVRAPGKRRWEQTLTAEEGRVATLAIPGLEDESKPPAPRAVRIAAPLQPEPSAGPWIPIAIGLGTVGVLSLGAGAFFGMRAIARNEASQPECPASVCSSAGATLREDALTAARASTILVGAGLGAIGAGAAVYWFRPRGRVAVTPTVGTGFTGVVVEGRF